jgi:hypothetical protein
MTILTIKAQAEYRVQYVIRHFLPSCPGSAAQSALPSPDPHKTRVAQYFACVQHRSGMLRHSQSEMLAACKRIRKSPAGWGRCGGGAESRRGAADSARKRGAEAMRRRCGWGAEGEPGGARRSRGGAEAMRMGSRGDADGKQRGSQAEPGAAEAEQRRQAQRRSRGARRRGGAEAPGAEAEQRHQAQRRSRGTRRRGGAEAPGAEAEQRRCQAEQRRRGGAEAVPGLVGSAWSWIKSESVRNGSSTNYLLRRCPGVASGEGNLSANFSRADWRLSMSSWGRPGRDSVHGRDSGADYGAQN